MIRRRFGADGVAAACLVLASLATPAHAQQGPEAPARSAPVIAAPVDPATTPAPGQVAVPPQPPAPRDITARDASPAARDQAVTAKRSREPAPLALARMSQDPTPTLDPATFTNTLRAADRYQAIVDAGGWPTLPAGTTLKAGDRGLAVTLLRRRLAATGDLAAEGAVGELFDAPVTAAVKRFQARHGLLDSGIVARQTVEAMNVPASQRQRQLAGSAGRLMGSNFAFGERYVIVNVPSAAVEAVERGAVAHRYVAVVGKPDRATPSVETRVTNINFNPTWTVPVSLIRKDIIPHMRKDPGYLAKMHIRMLDGQGHEVEPTRVDWSTEKAVNYTLRQDPGFDNSLGQVRIDMPNRHAVYMHDTPSKGLFSRDVRFHSSGCVRVAEVKDFVSWLLEGTPGPNGPGSAWGRMEVETGIATGERRDIKLAKPVPVAFVYLTGYATPDGQVHFRNDVYGLDAPPAAEAPVAAPVAAAPASTLPVAASAPPAGKAPAAAVPNPPAARSVPSEPAGTASIRPRP